MSSALADRRRVDSCAPKSGPPVSRLLLNGTAVAVWVCVVGFGVVAAPVLVAWVAAGASEPMGDALSVAAAGWLLGLGATLISPNASWNLTPLGLTLVSLVLAYRGAIWATESSRPTTGARAGALAAATAVTAAGLGALASSALSIPQITVDPGDAAAQAALVTITGAAVGMLVAEPDLREQLSGRLPGWLRGGAVPAAGAAATLLAVAAATMTAALLGAFGTVSSLVEQIDPGVAGLLSLLVLSLAYVPTLVVWTLAVLLGPGVSLGAQVSVTAQAVQVGPLPGFPLLGAVPGSMPGWVAALGPLALLGAGTVAGVLASRRLPTGTVWWQGLASSAVAGAMVALVVSVAAWAASGAMGPGDLAWVGVRPIEVGLVAGASVAFVAAASAAMLGWRSGRYKSSRDVSASLSAS